MKYLELNSSEYKKTLRLSIPVIIAQAGQITVGLIDNIMIGKLGTTPFAAASFTNTLFNLVLIFGLGYSFALTPLVGKSWGEKDHKTIGSWIKNGLMANAFMGVILVLVLLIMYFMIPFMGQPESVLQPSKDYLMILTISVFPMMVFYGYKQFAEGVGDTKTAMKIMLWANIINTIGNYIFMYGKLGAPEMGLQGAGVGTLISRIFMAVAFIVLFYKKEQYELFVKLYNQSSFCWKRFMKVVKLGVPLGGQTVMEACAFGLCAIMMGWVGEIGMAAHQIAITLSTLGFMIYQGLGAGTTIRVSHYKGQNDKEGIVRATKTAIMIMIIYSTFSVLLYWGARNILPLMFTQDPTVIQLAAQMLIVCGLFQLVDGVQIVIAGTLRGLADARIPAVITFISYFMLSIPFSYMSAFVWGYGAVGIWFGFPLGLFVCACLFQLRYKSILKKI
ncbi:MAG: MATE family efflux transporter [Prolixibacteraceae bacterium]|jgi:MATE family multidrug resistance protein|nr:MATE family efflux transporter [Prolixibacteraceae bacterium]